MLVQSIESSYTVLGPERSQSRLSEWSIAISSDRSKLLQALFLGGISVFWPCVNICSSVFFVFREEWQKLKFASIPDPRICSRNVYYIIYSLVWQLTPFLQICIDLNILTYCSEMLVNGYT